ncbi:MAG: helix-turn-helix domain-containing protein [Bacilli bacterium]
MVNITGDHIRFIRKLTGHTQQSFIGNRYSLTYLSRVETGRIVPSEPFLSFLQQSFNVNFSTLTDDFVCSQRTYIRQKFLSQQILTDEELTLLFHYYKTENDATERLTFFAMLILYLSCTRKMATIPWLMKNESGLRVELFMGSTHEALIACGLGEGYFYCNDYKKALSMFKYAVAYCKPEDTFLMTYANLRISVLCALFFHQKPIARAYYKEAERGFLTTFEDHNAKPPTLWSFLLLHGYTVHIHHTIRNYLGRRNYIIQEPIHRLVLNNTVIQSTFPSIYEIINAVQSDRLPLKKLLNCIRPTFESFGLLIGFLLLQRDDLKRLGQLVHYFDRNQAIRSHTLLSINYYYLKSQHFLETEQHLEYERQLRKLTTQARTKELWQVVADFSLELAEHLESIKIYKQALDHYKITMESRRSQEELRRTALAFSQMTSPF